MTRQLIYLSLRRPWWALRGYPAHRVSQVLEESQWWPRQKLEEFRSEKLRKLIDHCYRNVPFYRRVMKEQDLSPSNIKSATDLAKLPVLTKETLRANWKDLRATNISDKDVSVAVTSGSTGEPMKVVRCLNTAAWSSMALERGLSWGGLNSGTTYVRLWGGSLGDISRSWLRRIGDRVAGKIDLPAYDLRPENALKYAEIVREHQAEFIVGYASSIFEFARLLLARGERLKLHSVFTTAERLYPEWVGTMREAMGCKIYSFYGCCECQSLGYQCQEGNAYHVPEEHTIVEVESDSGQTSMVGTGLALVTDLDNYAMPLLRYRNGDYLTLEVGLCECGRPSRRITNLEGRIREFLLNVLGQRVSGGISTFIMRHVDNVDQFQVRQVALDRVKVLVVSRKGIPEDTISYVQKSFQHYLGNEVRVEIETVDSIPRTRSQKLQIVVNELL